MNAVEVQFYEDEEGNDGGLTDFLAEAATRTVAVRRLCDSAQ
jgi:hypothetical protein